MRTRAAAATDCNGSACGHHNVALDGLIRTACVLASSASPSSLLLFAEALLAVQAGILLMLLHQQPVQTDQSSFSPSCNLLPADRQRLQKYVPSIAVRLADAARQAF